MKQATGFSVVTALLLGLSGCEGPRSHAPIADMAEMGPIALVESDASVVNMDGPVASDDGQASPDGSDAFPPDFGADRAVDSGTRQDGGTQPFHIFVSDAISNQVVQMDDLSGGHWQSLGSPGNGVNQFGFLWKIFVDQNNHIYVADQGNARIVRMDDISGSNWVAYGTPGSGVGQFVNPTCVWADSAHIYICDGNDRVVRIDDMTGAGWITYGETGSGVGQFSTPIRLFVDDNEKLYISDSGNGRIVRIDDMTGSGWTTFGSQGSGTSRLNNPRGLFLDSAARIYISDASNNRIVRIDDMTGAGWVSLGGPLSGGGVGQFTQPRDLYVSRNTGQIYVADTLNYRLVRIDDMTGAGWVALGSHGTGVGKFSDPTSVFVTE